MWTFLFLKSQTSVLLQSKQTGFQLSVGAAQSNSEQDASMHLAKETKAGLRIYMHPSGRVWD